MKSWNHVVAITIMIAALVATAADERRMTIYTPQASYSVAVVERDGRLYVPLLDVLSPLGSASARRDGDKWKLKFHDHESEFKAGRSKVKVRGKNLDLPAPFLLDDDRGLLPLESLVAVASRLIPASLELREPAHRLFIGGAATLFNAELQPAGPKLVLRFSAPVSPSISTEPGTLKMVFSHEPVVAAPGTQTFDDKVIRAAHYSEHDGVAELSIQSGAPLLATFSDQNRTITLAPVPQMRPQAAPPVATPAPAPAPGQQPPSQQAAGSSPPAAPTVHARTTVVIDPGHGGEDRGAALSATLAEKDVTLAWARRLRAALEQKGIPSTLLREGDISLTSDQRAALANAARPLLFITLHAGTTGAGVRVYTAHLGEVASPPGSFLPWDAAQAVFLDGSRAVAGSVAAEMTKRSIPVGTAPVTLRPLNNVAASAIAIEVMPPAADVAGLMSTSYQQSVCAAIVDGLAAVSKPAPRPSGEGVSR